MMSDPIADAITRIRNAYLAGHKEVRVRPTKTIQAITNILVENKYAQEANIVEENKSKFLIIKLRYENRLPVITHLKRVSKPGRRVYRSVKDLKPTLNGRGISILTTPLGVISDKKAKKNNVGGEVICEVW